MEKIDLSTRFHHIQEPDRLEEFLVKNKFFGFLAMLLALGFIYMMTWVIMDGRAGDCIINYIQHLF